MKHVLFLIAILITLSTFAQKEDTVNFLKLSADDLKGKFGYKEKARIRIININRFLYKVTAEKTETDFNVTVPTILSAIKLPAFLSGQLPDTSGIGGAFFAPSPAPPGLHATSAEAEIDIKKNLKDLITAQQFINNAVNSHNKIVEYSKSCSEEYKTIEAKVISELKSLLTGTANTDIPSLTAELQTKLQTAITSSQAFYSNIEQITGEWQTLKLTEFRTDHRTKAEGIADEKNELADLQEVYKATKDPAKKKAALANVRAKEKEIASRETDLKEMEEDNASAIKDMTDLAAKAKTLSSDITKLNEEGKLYALINDIRKVNESNYTYLSEIVKMKKDEVKFNFSATSDGQLPCNTPNEQKFEVVLRTKGGVKLDFSTGVFFNFGTHTFLGNEYYYKPINDSVSQIRRTETGKRTLLGIGALMHVYQRSPAPVKLGAALGASTTTSFDAVNLHLGASLIFGDKDRLCLSGGFAFREAKLLDANYKENTDYSKKLLPEAVPTYKKFPKTGYFLSFTYNISRFSKG